jgi:hypothetical protein
MASFPGWLCKSGRVEYGVEHERAHLVDGMPVEPKVDRPVRHASPQAIVPEALPLSS